MPFERNHERREKVDSNHGTTERRAQDGFDNIDALDEATTVKNGLQQKELAPKYEKEQIEKKMPDDEFERFRQEILRKYPGTFSKSEEVASENPDLEALPETKVDKRTESKRERKPISWEYVAAFFDGEGSIGVTSRSNSVDLSLTFTQVDRRSLDEIAEFLKLEGIDGIGVYIKERKARHDIHFLVISTNEGVKRTLDEMTPYLRVKDIQAAASTEYLSDASTGNEYLSIINEETRAGRRAGRIHEGDLPYTRTEGIRIAREKSMTRARAVYEEMRKSPGVRQHENLGAIERNMKRGLKIRENILGLLESGEKNSTGLSALIERSHHQTNLHLRKLYVEGLVKRSRKSAVDPFVYELTDEGWAQRRCDSNQRLEE